MNKNSLTWLGCSSLAAILLTSHPANAGTVALQELDFVKPTTSAPTFSTSAQSNLQTALDPNSDTVGDLAIAKFGCDCPSCRNQALQMVQSGRLALPQ